MYHMVIVVVEESGGGWLWTYRAVTGLWTYRAVTGIINVVAFSSAEKELIVEAGFGARLPSEAARGSGENFQRFTSLLLWFLLDG